MKNQGYLLSICEKYSSYNKALGVVSYMEKFIKKCRKQWKEMRTRGEEKEIAEILVIKELQETHFLEDIMRLRESKCLGSKSKVKGLNPFLDEQVVLRVGGRLSKAKELNYEQKHPIILPNKSFLVDSLLRKIHNDVFHGGPNLILDTERKGRG
jgi:hypothetical protein